MFGFGKKKEKRAEPDAVTLEKSPLEEIWNISDHNKMIIKLYSYLCKKSDNGQDVSKLTDAEITFVLCQELEREVNNGGFHQFFYNSSGDWCAATPVALRQLGAPYTAGIVERAIALFERELPTDLLERRKFMKNVCTDDIMKALDACDGEFYRYKENLTELNYKYVTKHRANFH